MNNHLESRSEGQLTNEEVKMMADRLETNIISRYVFLMSRFISFMH
jgi:hypothetical protein